MKKFTERLTKRAAAKISVLVGGRICQDGTGTDPSPKPPIPLPTFYMLSHLEEDGPVRLDGVKLGICEVMGLELDEPRLGSFAGALNALDFPVQLLVRQHPPVLDRLRVALREAQPEGLPPKTKEAAESLRGLLRDLETREGCWTGDSTSSAGMTGPTTWLLSFRGSASSSSLSVAGHSECSCWLVPWAAPPETCTRISRWRWR